MLPDLREGRKTLFARWITNIRQRKAAFIDWNEIV